MWFQNKNKIYFQPSTINHQPSTINHQPSTINHQPSTINHQPSTINHQPSTINHQPSTINQTHHLDSIKFPQNPYLRILIEFMSENISIPSGLTKRDLSISASAIECIGRRGEGHHCEPCQCNRCLERSIRIFLDRFYFVKSSGDKEELVLGPFQGPVACTRIGLGKGVCGACWSRKETILVPDVDQFPGHIACSSLSRSEIVVPVFVNGKVAGVLDVDSDQLAHFDAQDAEGLEDVAALISGILWCTCAELISLLVLSFFCTVVLSRFLPVEEIRIQRHPRLRKCRRKIILPASPDMISASVSMNLFSSKIYKVSLSFLPAANSSWNQTEKTYALHSFRRYTSPQFYLYIQLWKCHCR